MGEYFRHPGDSLVMRGSLLSEVMVWSPSHGSPKIHGKCKARVALTEVDLEFCSGLSMVVPTETHVQSGSPILQCWEAGSGVSAGCWMRRPLEWSSTLAIGTGQPSWSPVPFLFSSPACSSAFPPCWMQPWGLSKCSHLILNFLASTSWTRINSFSL